MTPAARRPCRLPSPFSRSNHAATASVQRESTMSSTSSTGRGRQSDAGGPALPGNWGQTQAARPGGMQTPGPSGAAVTADPRHLQNARAMANGATAAAWPMSPAARLSVAPAWQPAPSLWRCAPRPVGLPPLRVHRADGAANLASAVLLHVSSSVISNGDTIRHPRHRPDPRRPRCRDNTAILRSAWSSRYRWVPWRHSAFPKWQTHSTRAVQVCHGPHPVTAGRRRRSLPAPPRPTC